MGSISIVRSSTSSRTDGRRQDDTAAGHGSRIDEAGKMVLKKVLKKLEY
jgi:hypothetical protein